MPSASALPPRHLSHFPFHFIVSLPLNLSLGRRLNGFLGLSLNDGTILFLVILLDWTVSVG